MYGMINRKGFFWNLNMGLLFLSVLILEKIRKIDIVWGKIIKV